MPILCACVLRPYGLGAQFLLQENKTQLVRLGQLNLCVRLFVSISKTEVMAFRDNKMY